VELVCELTATLHTCKDRLPLHTCKDRLLLCTRVRTDIYEREFNTPRRLKDKESYFGAMV